LKEREQQKQDEKTKNNQKPPELTSSAIKLLLSQKKISAPVEDKSVK